MKGNKKVYSKPDFTVMYYTPSDAVMTCTYTAAEGGACLIGGQSSESFPTGTTYYIGSYNGTTYIIWSYNYGGTNPSMSVIEQYAPYIQGVYSDANDGATLSSTLGWHIAEYSPSGWSGSAS